MSLENNAIVTRKIPRIDSDILKVKRLGKQKKYTPTRMKNAINKYFEVCEKEDDVPSIKGLMIHLNMYKDVFYKYLEYPEFTNIMEHARMIMVNWCESDLYRSKGIAAGKIAYMKNVHDWTEKVEQNQNINQRITTVDEARAKIEMLAPKLLEILKNNNVVNQLVIEAEVEEEPVSQRRV